MNTAHITYKIKSAAEKDILWHLTTCNNNFIPPLSDRVDIIVYAKKITEKAVTFEAWDGDILIGLVAAYINTAGSLFITNVSTVKEYMGKNIASALLKNCIEYAAEINCFTIHLEVTKTNIPVINFYKKHKFTTSGNTDDNLLMTLEIKKP